MTISIIIPARYGSSRYRGKPLVKILGKEMVIRVADICSKIKDVNVYIATDSKKIANVKEEKFTTDLISNFFKNGRSSYAEGLASLYTYERQIPEIAETKIRGLKNHYGVSSKKGLEFFEVHKAADVYHREACEKLLDDLSPEEQKKAEVSALSTAKYLWNFLSGIAEKHNIPRQVAA